MNLRYRQSQSRKAAFTLLELMVAAMMFAIVMATLATVFFGAVRLRKTNEGAFYKTHEIRQSFSYLKRDLRSITVPGTNLLDGVSVTGDTTTNGVTLSGVMKTGTEGTGSGTGSGVFSFYTASGMRISDKPWSEIQRIIYYVRSPADRSSTNGLELVRGVTRNLLPGINEDYYEQVLMNGVEQLLFEFWDGSSWLDNWDSTTQETLVPKLIRASIVMQPNDDGTEGRLLQMSIPVLVEQRTNTVVAATTTTATGGGR